MASKFVQLREISQLDSDTLLPLDRVLLSHKNSRDLEEYAKINVKDLLRYIQINSLSTLNIKSTYYPYLYEIYFEDFDYDYGINAFESYRTPGSTLNEVPLSISSAFKSNCLSIHKDKFVGHNLDKLYDELVSFIVRTPVKVDELSATLVRYPSIGISSSVIGLTKRLVDSKKYSNLYDIIPFYITSGINSQGLCVTVNQLPSDDDPNFDGTQNYNTTGTNPEGRDVCALMVARILLDKCGSIDNVMSELNNWNVWCPPLPIFRSEFSWTVSDATGRVVKLEIINNEFKMIEEGRENLAQPNVSTNFYLWKYDGNINNILIQDSDRIPMNDTLTLHSRGLERYKIVIDYLNTLGTVIEEFDLMTILKHAWYSYMYDRSTYPVRYSDYVKNWGSEYGDLTINSLDIDFNSIMNVLIDKYNLQRDNYISRLGINAFTAVSVVYNIDKRSMQVVCDEIYSTQKLIEFKL